MIVSHGRRPSSSKGKGKAKNLTLMVHEREGAAKLVFLYKFVDESKGRNDSHETSTVVSITGPTSSAGTGILILNTLPETARMLFPQN